MKTKAKKEPMRQCAGCNQRKPKKELVRIVKKPDDEIVLDWSGKVSGRGSYLCRDAECLGKVRKSGRIEKSLSSKIPNEVYDDLEEGLKLGNQ